MGFKAIVRAAIGPSVNRKKLAEDFAGQTLVASIMVICAESDGGISPDENLRMVQLLRQRFDLKAGEALALTTALADSFNDASDIDELLESVNRELSLSVKEDLMLMVIEVIAADNVKDPREILLLTNLVDQLNIPDDVMERVYAQYFEVRNKGRRK